MSWSGEESTAYYSSVSADSLAELEPQSSTELLPTVSNHHAMKAMFSERDTKNPPSSERDTKDEDMSPASPVTRRGRIDDFWSYSRKGRSVDQLCALMLHYGGLQGAVAGTVVALMCALLLPMHLAARHQAAALASVLAGACGCLLVGLAVAFLPNRRHVFVDNACISQEDETQKRLGILSLGYYVKHSNKMLVLWDSSFLSRVWCVYEVGVWLSLKAKGVRAPDLQALPVPDSMLILAGFAGSTFACLLGGFAEGLLPSSLSSWGGFVKTFAYLLVAVDLALVCSGYVAESVEQRRQAASFSIADAECFCCSCGHVHPETKEAMECDRLMVEDALCQWFGDEDTFDEAVRRAMRKAGRSASARAAMQGAVAVLLPLLWYSIASYVLEARTGSVTGAVSAGAP